MIVFLGYIISFPLLGIFSIFPLSLSLFITPMIYHESLAHVCNSLHYHSLINYILSLFPPLSPSLSDIPTWLKSLRLHKYQSLFVDMTYEELLGITEEFLHKKVT